VAAALAYIALAQLDRVAVLAWEHGRLEEFPLTRGKGRILTLIRFLEGLEADGDATDLAQFAHSFVHHLRRQGLVVLVSDLYDPRGFERGLDVIRRHHQELHLVQIYDRREADPGVLGDVQIFDVESGAALDVVVNQRSLDRYRATFRQFLDSVRDYANRYGIRRVLTTPDVPFDDLILQMMRASITR
jgi:uncharacterized protein (DUF58 family)